MATPNAAWLALLASAAIASSGALEAPPFTFNLDQSVPCPAGSADYSIATPLQDPAAAALQAGLAPVAAMVKAKLAELGCPSAGVIITQGDAD